MRAKRWLAWLLCLLLLPAYARCTDDEEDISYSPAPPPPTAVPQETMYPTIGEVQVTERLLVLSYVDKPITIWGNPDFGADGPAVPRLYQGDFPTYVCQYDGEPRSVETSGCSVVCLSMALYYLTGDTSQTPVTLFREACLQGFYRGNGVQQANIAELAEQHGVKAVRLGKKAANIRTALRKGYPLIASMDKGIFGGGHYILLRGLTEDDRLMVNDPNSRERSERTYPLASVFYELDGAMPLLALMPPDGSLED